MAGIPSWLKSDYIDASVAARKGERVEARVAWMRAQCEALAVELGAAPEAPDFHEAVRCLAVLALVGQGGPRDLGGPNGSSALPLVKMPHGQAVRQRAMWGGAWVEALTCVADPGVWRFIVRLADGRIHIDWVRHESRLPVISIDGAGPEPWLLGVSQPGAPLPGSPLGRDVALALARAIIGRTTVNECAVDVDVVTESTVNHVGFAGAVAAILRRSAQ